MSGKAVRSKNGCLTCRKRKRKCDEMHPACTNCQKNSFLCKWPVSGVKISSKDYKIEKLQTDPFRLVKIKHIQSKVKVVTVSESNSNVQVYDYSKPIVVTAKDFEDSTESSTSQYNNSLSPETKQSPLEMTTQGALLVEDFGNQKMREEVIPGEDLLDSDVIEIPRDEITFDPTAYQRKSSEYGLNSSISVFDAFSPETQVSSVDIPIYRDCYIPPSRLVSPVRELYDLVTVTENSSEVKKHASSPLGFNLVDVNRGEEVEVDDSYSNHKASLLSKNDAHRVIDVLSSAYDLTSPSTWIPGKRLTRMESFLFYTYVNRFIPTVTPHTYVKGALLPGTVFLPPALDLQCMRNLIFCCGAGYVSFYKPEYYSVFKMLYEKSVKEINDVVTKTRAQGTENWVFVASQNLVLLHRYFTIDPTKCSKSIALSYKFVQKRRAANIPITSDDKLLFESFLYNYCVMLLNCPDSEFANLPSPYKAFKILEEFYLVQDNNWLSLPIIGACFESLNILSKTIWLMRQKNRGHYFNEFMKLYDRILNFSLPDLPDMEIFERFSNKKRGEVHDSLLLSMATANAAKILLRLIIFNNVASDYEIQFLVKEIYDGIRNIQVRSSLFCICHLPLLITSVCSTEEEHRNFFLTTWRNIDGELHRFSCVYILDFIRQSWDSGVVDVNTFLNREHLDKVAL